MMVLRLDCVECPAKIAMTVLQAQQRRWICCRIAASGGAFFLGRAPREFVDHGVGSRVHFMAQKSNFASGFGNDFSHRR
jgi:hypothetical protein